LSDLSYFSVDLADKLQVFALIDKIRPETIIHTAAMSKPDECHFDREACLLNNVIATQNLVEAAQKVGARFVYFSTDFIFGEGGPHAENSLPKPLNFYGESKLMAEEIVQNSGLMANIVRPVFIYGSHWEGMRPSFIQWVQQQLLAKKPIKVVTDQKRTPTFVGDICKGVDLLLQSNSKETFHFAGEDIISPYNMALTVAKILDLPEELIQPVTADTFPEIVKRAKDSGLTIEKAKRILGYQSLSFEEGVRKSFGKT